MHSIFELTVYYFSLVSRCFLKLSLDIQIILWNPRSPCYLLDFVVYMGMNVCFIFIQHLICHPLCNHCLMNCFLHYIIAGKRSSFRLIFVKENNWYKMKIKCSLQQSVYCQLVKKFYPNSDENTWVKQFPQEAVSREIEITLKWTLVVYSLIQLFW